MVKFVERHEWMLKWQSRVEQSGEKGKCWRMEDGDEAKEKKKTELYDAQLHDCCPANCFTLGMVQSAVYRP